MRKPRSIFYLVYLLFHIGLLLAAIYANYKSEDFEFLLKLRERMDAMIYVGVVGLLLFSIDIVLVTMEVRNHKKDKEKLQHEINSLKAKMFDLQDATRSATSPSASTEEAGARDEEENNG